MTKLDNIIGLSCVLLLIISVIFFPTMVEDEAEAKDGEDGDDTYAWDEGIAP